MQQQEIDFFDRLAPGWDAAETRSTPGHVAALLAMLPFGPGMSVLDLGTGTGVLVPHLLEATAPGGSVTAVDASQGMLDRAIGKYGTLEGVGFLKADFEHDPLAGRHDVAMLYCVYPHLHHPRATLERLLRDNIKPGGMIVIAFPSDETFINSIHRERKAESDLLPPAPELAGRLRRWGFDAQVVAARPDAYIVTVRKSNS